MSSLQTPFPANLTISVMFQDEALLNEVKALFEEKYGAIDMVSPYYNFSDISEYYDPEMGRDIRKVVFSFKNLLPRDEIRFVKIFADEIEHRYLKEDGSRLINIDPGLVSLENFILTTGKNFTHRIYLGDGVFAEVTLQFSKTDIKELPWSYKDYLFEPAKSFLLKIRENYRGKLGEYKRLLKDGKIQ